MPRYAHDTATQIPPDRLHQQILEYLTLEGFKQIDPHLNVWKKGMGLMLGPQYVQFSVQPGRLHLEAWIKFALLPGWYVGEMGITGWFAVIPKKQLKKRVDAIERMAR